MTKFKTLIQNPNPNSNPNPNPILSFSVLAEAG